MKYLQLFLSEYIWVEIWPYLYCMPMCTVYVNVKTVYICMFYSFFWKREFWSQWVLPAKLKDKVFLKTEPCTYKQH